MKEPARRAVSYRARAVLRSNPAHLLIQSSSGGLIGRVQMPGHALAGKLWMAAQETRRWTIDALKQLDLIPEVKHGQANWLRCSFGPDEFDVFCSDSTF